MICQMKIQVDTECTWSCCISLPLYSLFPLWVRADCVLGVPFFTTYSMLRQDTDFHVCLNVYLACNVTKARTALLQ